MKIKTFSVSVSGGVFSLYLVLSYKRTFPKLHPYLPHVTEFALRAGTD